jgi:hypothetical protein
LGINKMIHYHCYSRYRYDYIKNALDHLSFYPSLTPKIISLESFSLLEGGGKGS